MWTATWKTKEIVFLSFPLLARGMLVITKEEKE